MIMLNNQKGIGLVEVLVALIILAIGVLGFAALQLRAIDATIEATDRAGAMNIARDLADRMRVNKLGLADYKAAINNKTVETGCLGTSLNYKPDCNATKMAKYDANEIINKATQSGLTIIIADCVGSSSSCIYMSWGKTVLTPTNLTQCINSSTGTYIADSKCLVMEAF